MTNHALCGLVARSPFKQQRYHFAQLHSAVKLLIPLLRNALDEDWVAVQKAERQIRDLSQEGERIARDICLHLPTTLFMPIPRGDIIDLLHVQSELGKCSSEAARLVSLRQMAIPMALQDELRVHLLRAVDAITHVMAIMEKLDELLESRFRGREAVLVQTLINELINIELSSRQRRDEAAKKLISLEANLPATEVAALDRFIELIADMSAQAKQVGLRLEQLLAA
ncbi:MULTISPECIES: DUF47 family protein [Stutzerimonas stutzeri subgroup]|uniref:Phosphate transport regulator n=1 Tax=Stutzerimonas stutzeri TaxID=316 RepID=A0A2N8RH49_STUST|nr:MULTISPECIES: DUF47 family protein [Stutzerimonas stutzeri subgroup]MBA1238686.1 DUF47 family protein [Stutzerimonas kunmingensis]MCQ4253377.1 DUF47 family protein [Stutzerimonas stutzeri]PNF60414.1 hypothetical protein CXK99_06855 [Stutzerimonas stutzeri]